jgi:hypothetical protein
MKNSMAMAVYTSVGTFVCPLLAISRRCCSPLRVMEVPFHDTLKPDTWPKQLVIFRPPSRHTYGFVDDDGNYDLPQLELKALLNHFSDCDRDFAFIPVQLQSRSECSNKEVRRDLQSSDDDHQNLTVQRKSKKRVHIKTSSRRVESLYWISGEIPPASIAKAASRAILKHATFLIDESHHFSEEQWCRASDELLSCNLGRQRQLNELIDVIDMTNPNMSLNERSGLIQRVSSLSSTQQLSFPKRSGSTLGEFILLHHISKCKENATIVHCIHFGWRTAIGAAGTRGAPSQTLRRTHRGILKEYALKKRQIVNASSKSDFVRSNVSTAMEPEIGENTHNLLTCDFKICSFTSSRFSDGQSSFSL